MISSVDWEGMFGNIEYDFNPTSMMVPVPNLEWFSIRASGMCAYFYDLVYVRKGYVPVSMI
jgi:hypothetical protein